MANEEEKESIKCGVLIADDYIEARKKLEGIIIVPFDKSKAKGIGYNLSPSILVYSVNNKKLVNVHQNDKEVFVWVNPHDTILTLSKEYLIVDSNIVGTFHSRVRMSAEGLGNVSTTLDPNWKGKLLFAINNPTKKRIKLRLEEKSEGKTKTIGLVTMVLSWTGKAKDNASVTSLHLDNPPMRTDIWKDLTEKPAGIRGAKYAEFQDVIQSVTEFEAQKGKRYYELQEIINTVTSVRASIMREDALNMIQSITVRQMEELKVSQDEELKEKFNNWNGILQEAKELDELNSEQFKDCENLLIRECRYLIMCDEVAQQDENIRAQIERYWAGNFSARLFKKYIIPNLVPIVTAITIILMLIFCTTFDDSMKTLLSILTPLIIALLTFLKDKIEKKQLR